MDKDIRFALAMMLIEKAMRINGLNRRKKSLTGELPTIFAEFSGHVATVEIGIFDSGWVAGGGGERYTLHLDLTDGDFMVSYKTISSRLDEVQKKAEEILTKAVAADA